MGAGHGSRATGPGGKPPGTLGTSKGHGVGNPRDLVSGRPTSLLKFQSTEILKAFIEKPLKRRAYDRSHVPIQERLRRTHRPLTELHHLAEGKRSTGPVPNGKQVDVLATEALIRDTADPSKAAVAARHQQERLQRNVYSHVATQSEPTNMAAPPPVDPAQGQSPDFQKARAHREHYLARMAEMEFRKAQGELVEISFVQKAAFETARSLNHSLMSLSPPLAPQLAALSDPWVVERQLTAALRQRLNEAAQVSSDDFGFAFSEC